MPASYSWLAGYYAVVPQLYVVVSINMFFLSTLAAATHQLMSAAEIGPSLWF